MKVKFEDIGRYGRNWIQRFPEHANTGVIISAMRDRADVQSEHVKLDWNLKGDAATVIADNQQEIGRIEVYS